MTEGADDNDVCNETTPLVAHRVDGGKQANLVLLGCCLMQFPVWGFVISYGALQDYYTSTPDRYKGDINQTGVIGPILNGIIYLSMPIFFGLFSHRFAHFRRPAAFLGITISALSLAGSSFADSVWQLVLTQGVLQAFGSTILYSSTTIFVDEWFHEKKGLAYGVTLATKGVIGIVAPIAFQQLLHRLGFRLTLLVWTGIIIVMTLVTIPLLRPRQKFSVDEPHFRGRDWSFLNHRTFYIFQVANIIFSAGYALPQTYLASFASDILGFTAAHSALILTATNAPHVLACVWFGFLSDGRGLIRQGQSMPITYVCLLSAMGGAMSTLLIWGFVPNKEPAGAVLLTLFAIMYGLLPGGWSSTWGGIVKEMQREADANGEDIDTGLLFGLLNGGRGIGFVASGFIGVELLELGSIGGGTEDTRWAYGSSYGSLILFVGLTAASSGLVVLSRNTVFFRR